MKAQAHISEDAFLQARINMIECQIRPGGVRDARVCRAIQNVPREIFVTASQRDIAYADCPVDMVVTDQLRRLAMPHSFGAMVEAAAIAPEDVILDIGCGSGYSAAVLSHLGATVIALEENEGFAEKANELWGALGIDNCVSVTGALTEGLSKQAPFDVIFVNGFVEQIPESLLAQLAPDGRLICVSQQEGARVLTIVQRMGEHFAHRYGAVLSVPQLHSFDRTPDFSF